MKQLQTVLAVIVMMIVLGLILVFDPFGLIDSGSGRYASKVLLKADPGPEWDAKVLTSSSVVYDENDGKFKMWYVGNGAFERSGIGYAESEDGLNWSPHSSSPVIESEPIDPSVKKEYDWDAGGIRAISVIQDGDNFKMWYSAQEWGGTGQMQIGYAESRDGIHWSKYSANPVFSYAPDGAWDSHSVTEPFVMKDGSTYKLWYTGIPADSEGGRSELSAIGYAESSNGKSWERAQSVPVVQARKKTWNEDRVSGPMVIKHKNSVYEMWFSGSDGKNAQLGRAYSQDGLSWAEDELNPLVQDDDSGFYDPFIAYVNQQYFIWLTRFDKRAVPQYSLQFTMWPMDDTSSLLYLPNVVPSF